MDSKINKNFSPHSIRTTCQELQLKQIFHHKDIPFEFQKQYSLPDRQYIVDFLMSTVGEGIGARYDSRRILATVVRRHRGERALPGAASANVTLRCY